jgi:hypothetical protein
MISRLAVGCIVGWFIQFDCHKRSQRRVIANEKIDRFSVDAISPSLATGIGLVIAWKIEKLSEGHLGKDRRLETSSPGCRLPPFRH